MRLPRFLTASSPRRPIASPPLRLASAPPHRLAASPPRFLGSATVCTAACAVVCAALTLSLSVPAARRCLAPTRCLACKHCLSCFLVLGEICRVIFPIGRVLRSPADSSSALGVCPGVLRRPLPPFFSISLLLFFSHTLLPENWLISENCFATHHDSSLVT